MIISKLKLFESSDFFEDNFKHRITWELINYLKEITDKYTKENYTIEISSGVRDSEDETFFYVWSTVDDDYRDSGYAKNKRLSADFLNFYMQRGIYYSLSIYKENSDDIDENKKIIQQVLNEVRNRYKINAEYDEDNYDTVVISQSMQ